MRSTAQSIAFTGCMTMLAAFLLRVGVGEPGTRQVCALRASTLADSDEARWEPTEAPAASRLELRWGDHRLTLQATARGAVLIGSTRDGERLEPEAYDPATRRWTPHAGLVQSAPAAQRPTPPSAHHRVTPCGAGCFLAVPSAAEAAAGVASPDRSPRATVFVHDGAWRPAGVVPVYFKGTVLAARTPSRLVALGRNTYFYDALETESFGAWVREGDGAWSDSPFDREPPDDASRIAATPSGAVVAIDVARFGVIRLPAAPVEGDGVGAWRNAGWGRPMQAATLLADGSVLAVETICRERPDLSGLASRWWYPLLASLCVALPVVLARRGRASWSSVAVGAALGVALLMPAYLLLSAALRR